MGAPIIAAVALACQPVAVDGDTLKLPCTHERIRLTAIDAPEMPGHCRTGRDCAPGDPFASKAAMVADLASGPLTIERLGTDHYGRTTADVFANGKSLSCLQLAGGFARYWHSYDRGNRIGKECGVR